ncbi:methyl-binding domain-containing protein 4 [Colletotrichum plurivorum]|uniref:Methyl-binding domain-containing protein 4 n=1 Tax=Colletotrichum plurivorum TaxID=2175906 RepID=A0A8H6K190_9PEZI|nr:methyl-binding domain-containing protein 4 [Colletotrichum plurivorum]
MANSLAYDVFEGFDVPDHEKEYLFEVLTAPNTPREEKLAIFDLSLLSGFEDWYLLLERAALIRERNPPASDLDARDLLAFVPRVDEATRIDEEIRQGWAATDQSIKNLTRLLQVHQSPVAAEPPSQHAPPRPRQPIVKKEAGNKRQRQDDPDDEASNQQKQRVKRQRAPKPSTSHYFAQAADGQSSQNQPLSTSATTNNARAGTSAVVRNGITTPRRTPPDRTRVQNEAAMGASGRDPLQSASKTGPAHDSQGSSGRVALLAHSAQLPNSDDLVRIIVPRGLESGQNGEVDAREPSPKRKAAVRSHFFGEPPAKQSPNPKRTAGLVSTIPFPPLSAPQFGLIQEECAHEPFWLLVVVTLLIKTAGKQAIPTFYQLKERFPTPAALADPEATSSITDIIRHLGLSARRTASIQRFARLWLQQPPKAGVTFAVKDYDKRDVPPTSNEEAEDVVTVVSRAEADDAWEMGHFMQGKYALDSWRIFCRDELLGRAEDWNGRGGAPNFQPEWMRVRPDDKELRACLRWMWMREGWEWDPATGERTVLREEMRLAVDEGRVEYDDTGGLRILDEPRSGAA